MTDNTPLKKMTKTDAEWRKILSPELYRVARQQGTERPHVGEYTNVFNHGHYVCACCNTKLFDSTMKFPTHCGWPSFAKPISEEVIDEHEDRSHGMQRTEVTCHGCDAHLGHVFPDGPREMGGLRYCINSISLKLIETD